MSSPESNNPYQVPTAAVEEASSLDYSMVARTVPAMNGVTWVNDAWKLFMKAPGALILVTILYGIVSVLSGLMPLINVVSPLIGTVLMGGYYVVLARVDRDGEAKVEDLFSAFNTHLLPLAILGLILMATMFVGILLLMASGMTAALSGMDHNMGAGSLSLLMVGVIVGLTMIIIAYFAVIYATLLMVVGNQPVGTALRNSVDAGVRNILPFLMFSLVTLGIMLVTSLPIVGGIFVSVGVTILGGVLTMLSYLVVTPVLFAANYMSFKDIFSAE